MIFKVIGNQSAILETAGLLVIIIYAMKL